MKSLLTYYGGKQRLAPVIVPYIPPHLLYAEPFAGGAAIFFAKQPSAVEILNDLNGELINFYQVVKEKFDQLENQVQRTLHSRRQHQHAWVIYNFPELFNDVSRAWATWILSTQSFASRLDGSWGYDITEDTTTSKFATHKADFLRIYAKRLEHVQLENSDALYVIRSRDNKDAFFYCDPPYFNSDMGHYKGYTVHQFEILLQALSLIEGKFLLSSYPSSILDQYTTQFNWQQKLFDQIVSVAVKEGNPKTKTEVLTANYPLEVNQNQLLLF